MRSPDWIFLDKRMSYEHLGLLPDMLDKDNPSPAREQLNQGYQHGGGWNPFEGFTLQSDNTLKYTGDPPTRPLAYTYLRKELIVFYPHSWVAIIQPDRKFEVARMD